jgi:hypothetical protein
VRERERERERERWLERKGGGMERSIETQSELKKRERGWKETENDKSEEGCERREK